MKLNTQTKITIIVLYVRISPLAIKTILRKL